MALDRLRERLPQDPALADRVRNFSFVGPSDPPSPDGPDVNSYRRGELAMQKMEHIASAIQENLQAQAIEPTDDLEHIGALFYRVGINEVARFMLADEVIVRGARAEFARMQISEPGLASTILNLEAAAKEAILHLRNPTPMEPLGPFWE